MKKELQTVVNEESLAFLRSEFPQEQGFRKIVFPRLGLVTQDITEGRGKNMKVITEAGTFFIERASDELDENGKKVFEKEEIGMDFEGTIIYQRRQLKYYDESNEKFVSSPVFDTDNDIVPLFCDKKEIARGTPAELKARPEYSFEKDGKQKSKLEEARILYILKDGELFEMNIRGSSMYSYMSYARKTLPPAVLTKFSSEAMEKGQIAWNKLVLSDVKKLDQAEVDKVMTKISEIKEEIGKEQAYFKNMEDANTIAVKALDEF